jgi:hypothetical protein
VPELRHVLGYQLRDRAGVLRATVNRNDRSEDLVCERAPSERLGVSRHGQSCLDGDARVQRSSCDSHPAELVEVHRDEIRSMPPGHHRRHTGKRIRVNRSRRREPNRNARGRSTDRRYRDKRDRGPGLIQTCRRASAGACGWVARLAPSVRLGKCSSPGSAPRSWLLYTIRSSAALAALDRFRLRGGHRDRARDDALR